MNDKKYLFGIGHTVQLKHGFPRDFQVPLIIPLCSVSDHKATFDSEKWTNLTLKA